MSTPEIPIGPQQPVETPQKSEAPVENPIQAVEQNQTTKQSTPQPQQPVDDSNVTDGLTPPPPTISIQLPADPQQLLDWSHQKPDNAVVWFALFWIRLMRKAAHFGWKMLTKGGQVYVPTEEMLSDKKSVFTKIEKKRQEELSKENQKSNVKSQN